MENLFQKVVYELCQLAVKPPKTPQDTQNTPRHPDHLARESRMPVTKLECRWDFVPRTPFSLILLNFF